MLKVGSRFGSVCAGIGAFDLAFERQGFTCAWQIEIDEKCNKVLKHHFPYARRYQDLTQCTKDSLTPIEILCGGTPCQGFSISGLRGGLADNRSNLCFHFCRLANELDPGVILWENVPDALNLPDNAFGCFLAALVGADAPLLPPTSIRRWRDNKSGLRYFSWPNAGMAAGPLRSAVWRVLDSQYFGLAQRRQRLFVVANSHHGERPLGETEFQRSNRLLEMAATILFEPEMLRRHHPPSREAGQSVSATLGAGSKTGGWNNDLDRSGAFILEKPSVPDDQL